MVDPIDVDEALVRVDLVDDAVRPDLWSRTQRASKKAVRLLASVKPCARAILKARTPRRGVAPLVGNGSECPGNAFEIVRLVEPLVVLPNGVVHRRRQSERRDPQ